MSPSFRAPVSLGIQTLVQRFLSQMSASSEERRMMRFMASSRWELGREQKQVEPCSCHPQALPGLRMVTGPRLVKGVVSFKG